VVFAGWLFRLNRLKMYIAANVSNPLFAPVLILVEIQLGAWLQRRQFHALTLAAIRSTDPWAFGLDLLLGSVVLGLVGGLVVGTATYMTSRRDDAFEAIAVAAADRYLRGGIVAWEFARGKLRGDPVYREAVTGRLLHSGGRLVDVGCGQGLALAVLAEARARVAAAEWPASLPQPAVFEELVGIELRPRIAQLASCALGAAATIHVGDAAEVRYPPASAVLLFDVLHMMPAASQEALLRSIAGRLEEGGVLLVREADAAAGSAFQFVRFGNALKALFQGNWRQRFTFRTADEWARVFRAAGFDSQVRGMGSGTPFANVLFTLRKVRDQRS
jgi:SAM-dependent methyltransferase